MKKVNKFSSEHKNDRAGEKKKRRKKAVRGRTGEEQVRLNKYLADAGVCSRREADKLIEAGLVKVNGTTVTRLGTKVKPDDKVYFDGRLLRDEKKYYLLLNKPKGYITTTDDPFERKTVMELVKNACKERIYPAGRLDRNTTGLLLFTNDGELAKKLTHPRHRVRKIYHVTLDKKPAREDMERIAKGIELDDGMVRVDKIARLPGEENKTQVGIELHSGKNRVVRRIFEALGYQVVKLDRVAFAGLTKKNLPRGKWRFLTEKEVNFLKMIP